MFLNRLRPSLFRISTKLTLVYSLVLILSSTAIFTALYWQMKDSFVEQKQNLVVLRLETYRNYINIRGQKDFEDYFQTILDKGLAPNLLIALFSPRGEMYFMYEPPGNEGYDFESLKERSLNQKDTSFSFVDEGKAGHSDLVVAGAVLDSGSRMLIASPVADVGAPLAKAKKAFLWLLLPSTIICFLGGIYLASRTLNPVRELLVSMKKIGTGSLSTRVPLGGSDDELEELKILCNRMLDKIENLVSGLKEAFDHLAHDIRTPVTRLRGRAELALNNDSDAETYREALQSCYENSDRILNFLQVLTDITETENRSRKLKLEKKYISELVEEMMDLYEMAFEEKNIKVFKNLDSNDWALVDSRLISRVIANLLDNAHKYTPEGGQVTITTLNNTESVVLKVTDTGPGISPEEHAMIWQKLYRSDKSRSEYGMGLGLTFVRAVVRAHDGTVSVRSPVADGQGTEFEVHLQKMS